MRAALSRHSIHFAEEMVPPFKPLPPDSTQPNMLQRFCTQLKAFREEIKEPQDLTFQDYKKKRTGKSPGQPDDMCMAALMNFYYTNQSMGDRRFLEIMRVRGLRTN